MKWKEHGKMWLWPVLKYYPQHLCGVTEENRETQHSWSLGKNLYP
jgi:hypothetical protein